MVLLLKFFNSILRSIFSFNSPISNSCFCCDIQREYKKILYQIVKELFAAAFGGFVQLLLILTGFIN